jgi:hypothetical protein
LAPSVVRVRDIEARGDRKITLFASERTLSAYNPGDKGWVIEDEDFPGQLLSFLKSDPTHWRGVKVIPRITSKGILCGAVYKVASRAKLAF